MAHVQAPRRVREHLQAVELRAARPGRRRESPFRAPALLPLALQSRISYPQDRLEGNELYPTIAGRACSSRKETDPEGKLLKTAIVGDIFERDFYETVSFATVFSAITGTIQYEENGQKKNGLTGLKLVSPRQDIARKEGNQFLLTNKNIVYPCGAQSQGRAVPQKPLAVSGELAPGATPEEKLNVTATVPDEQISIARRIKDLFFAGKCAISAECRELGLSLGTNATLTVVAPGYVALAGLTYDTKGDLAPNLQRENPQAYRRLTSYKGWTNTFRPAKLTFAGSITQEDGTTKQEIVGRAEASPGQDTLNLNNLPWRGSHGVVAATNKVTDCMIVPKAIQDKRGYECGSLPTDTSDWAQENGFTAAPLDSASPSFSGEFGDLLKTIAGEIGLPACVLNGVALIEGGPNMGEIPDIAPCLARVNSCSAAGPMQFTTGRDANNNAACPNCQSSWVQENGCPNAWATWGDGGNPCLYRDSLRAAARKLKSDGGLTNADPTNQQAGIEEAGYRYYGSKKPVGRLGGLSYGQFLYAHCKTNR